MAFANEHPPMTVRAEAVVTFSPRAAGGEARAAARKLAVECEFRPGSIRILAHSTGGMAALTAAAEAALALIAALKDDNAAIESVKLVGQEKAQRAAISRGSLSKERPTPQALTGEVSAPRPMPDNRREAFRNFMTAHRLRPTIWAKEAGVASGEILGYLTGRSRGFSGEVAEKLARAAKVRVEDMFK
jgi:pimeloyl-ACP methyl ester carboxylesterase